MHFQTSTGNSSGPTALSFFILLSAFFTSSLLTQFTSSLTTSASSVLSSLSFSSFISFLKYSFHLFNTSSKLTITLPFLSFKTLTCCLSFPALSLCLPNLYNSFSPSFISNLVYKSSSLQLPSLPYSSYLYISFYSFYFFVPCFLRLFFSFMLSCTSPFHYHVSPSFFLFPNVTSSTISAVFLSIFAVLSHSSGNPFLPPKILVTSHLNAS